MTTSAKSKVNRERPALDRDAIAREALAMLDEEGLDALSMRRLADRLGVGTMTLYGYFRSKDELLEAAVGAAAEDFDFDPPEGGVRERFRAYVHAVQRVLERHPALPQFRARRPIVGPRAFGMTERGIQILLDAGFPPKEAARVFRVLFIYKFGSALFGPEEVPPEQRRAVRASIAALPEDEFPAVTAAVEGITESIGGREQFDFGLELILDAIEARAARYSAASSHQ
ncbi:MAG: TetR/AcrR family transcriptional regulator [Actinomycetota bacterium]|nr:TetR/AcrR family transcriptional regulator [Actinomycetota bacterium]MDQ5807598.1 TetR/AcrR family transcriptional regulator [Actinomycetota bacterium]